MLGGPAGSVYVSNAVGTSTTNIYSITLPIGSWIIIGNAYFPSATTFSLLSISNISGTSDNYSISIVQGSGNIALNVVRGIVITSGTQTWYLIGQTGVSITLSQSSFYAYRVG